MIRTAQVISDDKIEKETLAMMEPTKLMKKKVEISDGVRKKKFVFNTRGNLTKGEVVELRRKHSNIFDWAAKEQSKQAEQSRFEKMVKDVEMVSTEEQALEREERLQRLNIRKQEFRVKKMCKDILEDEVTMSGQYRSVEMATMMVERMADKAVEDDKINMMLRTHHILLHVFGHIGLTLRVNTHYRKVG
jgi:hypothetical protein